MSGSVPTMATDGRRIVFNPAFVDGLKPAELEATLAHEVMHCALGHHCRRGERDPRLWNEAADLAINPILVGNGFTLPAGALIDPAFSDLSAEEIYARLLRDKNDDSDSGSKQTPQQAGTGGGGASQDQQQPRRTDSCPLQVRIRRRSKLQVRAHWRRDKHRNPARPNLGQAASVKSWTQRMTKATPLRRQRRAASSTSGASRRTKPYAQRRRAEMSLRRLSGHCAKAASQRRTGARSCATLLPRLRRRIIAGVRRIAAISPQDCTCLRSIAGALEKS